MRVAVRLCRMSSGFAGITDVLAEARRHVAASGADAFVNTPYGSAVEALRDFDRLRADSSELRWAFAPTGWLQDVSIEAGWGDAFLSLAARMDAALRGEAGAPATADLLGAMERVEQALAGLQAREVALPWNPQALEALATSVGRAIALARFDVPDERDGPFLDVSFGSTPQEPRTPMFPAFVALWTAVGAPVAAMMAALEALQRELVWAADCAEFSDARNTSIQYLRAAGHLEQAAEHLIVYARRADFGP